MYEVGLSHEFRAQHVMPGSDGPEGRLHHHDYRLETVVTVADLDEQGMVVDLDVLDAALAEIVSMVDGADLETIRPAAVEAVTVEVLARWAHDQLARRLHHSNETTVSIRVWESPRAFGGYSAPLSTSS